MIMCFIRAFCLTFTLLVLFMTKIEAQTEFKFTDNPEGVLSSQYDDSPSGEDINNLIDNDLNSKYLTFHSSAWIVFEVKNPFILNKYIISSANDAPERDPLNWTLEGSFNGLSYHCIDIREGQDFVNRGQKKEFLIEDNVESYTFYRLSMTNNSGNILQLAEIEMYGVTGESFNELLVDFSTGSYHVTNRPISFINGSLNATSYQWAFEGASPKGSTDISPQVTYTNPGEYEVSLTAFDDVSTKTKTEIISIKDINDWSEFIYPEVQLECTNEDNPGYLMYLDLVKANGFESIQDFVKNCCLVIAQKLYFTVNEANDHNLRSIHYKLTEGGALSYKGGDVPNIEIGFDMEYLNSFSQKYGIDICADEIFGILCHEICHGYQNSPKNCGIYGSPNEYYGFIEGTADLARLLTGGFNPERYPSTGGSWIDGYNTTAFFYSWIQNSLLDEDFLKKLNLSAKQIDSWSLNEMLYQEYGQSVNSLWAQYQKSILNVGLDNRTEGKIDVWLTNNKSVLTINNLPEGVNNVIVYNLNGSVTLKEKKVGEESQVCLKIDNLDPGVYVVQVINKGIQKTQKIIK